MHINRFQKRKIGALSILVIVLVAAYFIQDREKATLTTNIRATLPGQFVDLPDGAVHYELAGPEDAAVVVLVNGFSVPYYVWDPNFEALTAAGYRTLRYDLYGRGYSDRPEVEYNLDLFTGQLEGLLTALEIAEPVALVGLSFGGPVVAAYAHGHPDQVRALVLLDPQVACISPADIFPMNMPWVGEYIMAVYMAPSMLPHSQANDFYQPERFPEWEEKYRDQLQYAGFRRAILSTMRNMVWLDPLAEYEALSRTNIPVLLVWGREDRTISAADIALVREAIPEAVFQPVDNAGHLPHYEQAGTVNPLLIEFLKRAETGRP